MKKFQALTLILMITVLSVAAQSRKVLVYQFTNSGCPPCEIYTPIATDYVDSNMNKAIMISVHTSFPYLDSMYYENAIQNDYQSVLFGVLLVPFTVLDGTYLALLTDAMVADIDTYITTRAAEPPRYQIQFLNTQLINNNLTATIRFVSVDSGNVNDLPVAHIAIVEKDVQKSAYIGSPGSNAETHYEWVLRQLLPDENGTALTNSYYGGVDTLTVNWTLNNFKDLSQCRVIAYVSNVINNEIFQSEIEVPQFTFTAIAETQSITNAIYYDNQTQSLIVSQPLKGDCMVDIFDAAGRKISSSEINSLTNRIEVEKLNGGVYFVQIKNSEILLRNKFFVFD